MYIKYNKIYIYIYIYKTYIYISYNTFLSKAAFPTYVRVKPF